MDLSQSNCSFQQAPVLPPIINNDKDRRFLVELNDWIHDELIALNNEDIQLRYPIYKEAFTKLIAYVSAYRPLMTQIKREYEEVIGILERGEHEAFYLTGKLSEMVNAPATLRNYQRRTADLQNKLEIIANDNERLQLELEQLQAARHDREQQRLAANTKQTMAATLIKTDDKKDRKLKPIPGLSLEHATDVATLTHELDKLDHQHRELNIARQTRYAPREHRDELRSQLNERVHDRDQLQTDISKLRFIDSRLRVCVDAAHTYLNIQLPHQMIGDAILLALHKAAQDSGELSGRGCGTPTTATETDSDIVDNERDADAMLEYIERFNELMEDKLFNEAAMHAVNSPHGILRTMETMNRFIDVSTRLTQHLADGATNPLLTFCIALLSTVDVFHSRPNDVMSLHCVQCALRENRHDLISHWLSQDRLTLTVSMADIIYQYSIDNPHSMHVCLSLAHKIYAELGAHIYAMVCMVRLGRVTAALQYAQRTSCQQTDLLQVLRQCPDRELARALCALLPCQQATDSSTTTTSPWLPVGVVMTTLLETDSVEVLFSLLNELHTESRTSVSGASLFESLINADLITTEQQWLDIVNTCQQHAFNEHCTNSLLTAFNTVQRHRQQTQENTPQ